MSQVLKQQQTSVKHVSDNRIEEISISVNVHDQLTWRRWAHSDSAAIEKAKNVTYLKNSLSDSFQGNN